MQNFPKTQERLNAIRSTGALASALRTTPPPPLNSERGSPAKPPRPFQKNNYRMAGKTAFIEIKYPDQWSATVLSKRAANEEKSLGQIIQFPLNPDPDDECNPSG